MFFTLMAHMALQGSRSPAKPAGYLFAIMLDIVVMGMVIEHDDLVKKVNKLQ